MDREPKLKWLKCIANVHLISVQLDLPSSDGCADFNPDLIKIGQIIGSCLSIKTERLLKDGFVDSSSQVQESGTTDPNVVPYCY